MCGATKTWHMERGGTTNRHAENPLAHTRCFGIVAPVSVVLDAFVFGSAAGQARRASLSVPPCALDERQVVTLASGHIDGGGAAQETAKTLLPCGTQGVGRLDSPLARRKSGVAEADSPSLWGRVYKQVQFWAGHLSHVVIVASDLSVNGPARVHFSQHMAQAIPNMPALGERAQLRREGRTDICRDACAQSSDLDETRCHWRELA